MRKVVAGLVGFALLVCWRNCRRLGRAHAQVPKLTDITFSLDFIVLGRHAPFYVAIEKGFYKEENLNVNIISAKGTAQAIQNVESGLAQIGFIDVASLVVARAEGSTVKVVSVIYQKAPFCFFSLDPGANVTKLKDFEGLQVGSNTGSYISEHRQGDDAQGGPRPEQAQRRKHRAVGAYRHARDPQDSGDRLLHHDQARDGARGEGRQGRHLPVRRSRSRPLFQWDRGEGIVT